jgi:hypothetical protein
VHHRVAGTCNRLISSERDGVTVHVLLHIVDGLMKELEVYREDSAPVNNLEPHRLGIMVL